MQLFNKIAEDFIEILTDVCDFDITRKRYLLQNLCIFSYKIRFETDIVFNKNCKRIRIEEIRKKVIIVANCFSTKYLSTFPINP